MMAIISLLQGVVISESTLLPHQKHRQSSRRSRPCRQSILSRQRFRFLCCSSVVTVNLAIVVHFTSLSSFVNVSDNKSLLYINT